MSHTPSSSQSELSSRLRAIIAAFPGPGFALVDGGHFKDLPALFKRERLFARSLFLDTADTEMMAAGPWLVRLDQSPEAVSQIFALADAKPATVFWCCEQGEQTLWRHLRTLNLIEIPAWAAGGGTEPPDDGSGQEQTTVMFRHWDPRVLGALLPALDTAQFARILGPGKELAFRADEYGGVRRVRPDPTWPTASGGLLAVRPEQIGAMNAKRHEASRRRISAYLRTYAPDQTSNLDDDKLSRTVGLHQLEAEGFGVQSESTIAMWCFLRMTNTTNFSQDPHVVRFMAHPANGVTADDRVWKLAELRRIALKARFG